MLNQSETLQHSNSNLCWLSTFASCSLKSAKDEATASPDAAAQISLRDSSMEGSSQLNIHFFKLSVLKNKFTAQTSFLGRKKKKSIYMQCIRASRGTLKQIWSGPCLHQQEASGSCKVSPPADTNLLLFQWPSTVGFNGPLLLQMLLWLFLSWPIIEILTRFLSDTTGSDECLNCRYSLKASKLWMNTCRIA